MAGYIGSKAVFLSTTTASVGGDSTVGGDLTVSGLVTASDGAVIDNDGATVLTVDRATSDGTIVDVQKDGSTVGSIGANGTKMYTGSGATGLHFNRDDASIEPYNPLTISTRDAAIDLGSPDERFKDLYLSGGAYLGGAGSANYLDDYEEGTWTPTLTFNGGSTGITYNTGAGGNAGQFVRIGQMVWVWFNIYLSNKGSSTGDIFITGVPFTAANTFYNENGGSLHDWINFNSVRSYISTYVDSQERIQLRHTNLNSGSATGMQNMNNTHLNNNSFFRGWACYRTNS